MIPAERLSIIKKTLLEKKQIDIASLSEQLSVTEVTVRRDLEKLETDGFLRRTHGGAILLEDEGDDAESVLSLRNDDHSESRKIIGQIASLLVEDGDVIFLGPGMCCRYIAKALVGRSGITVLTNDLLSAIDLSRRASGVKVLCPGGDVVAGQFQLYGRGTESAIKSLYFDLAFIEVEGVSFERGYSVSSLDKAYLAKDSLSVCKRAVAVCDHERFGTSSFAPLGPIDMFRAVISDEETPDEYKEYFFKNEIQVFCTVDVYGR